ncbi:hypothetical protein [Nonlabens antarcticus]|uniref:hypothetical protein n=1 Tax=Nonlabens antarcticus TaxID=392714 RepID=UPI001891E436|nr:hypothetical protein [Nonlabens antarcticus]
MRQLFICLRISFLPIILLWVSAIYAQVGINTITPNGILDVNSTTNGVVLPRIALTATNLMAPVKNPQTGNIPTGTVVYNTSSTRNAPNAVSPGIYVWNGSKWVSQFTKKQTAFYESGKGFRAKSSDAYKNIPNLVNKSFTPKFTGNYKMELSVNYGGGYAITPIDTNSGNLNVAAQSGLFRLRINTNGIITNYFIRTQSFSAAYGNQQYFDIWEKYSSIINLSLEVGAPISFSLAFNQDPAPEFVDSGDLNEGRGYVASELPCTVEITYIDP